MKHRSSALIAAAMLILISSVLRSQEPPHDSYPSTITKAPAHYPNKARGLQSFLEAILSESQSGNSENLKALIKETEIPDDRTWFYSMYPADKAESWIVPYEHELGNNEQTMMASFSQFAKSAGKFNVRKVNDDPQPGRGLEWGMLHSSSKPLDIYYASWKPKKAGNANEQPIGYFYYINGGFRWDSLIVFMSTHISNSTSAPDGAEHETLIPLSSSVLKVGNGVSSPRLIHRAEAEYTDMARRDHINGTVKMSCVVAIDGRVESVKVLRPLGSGLDEQAAKALRTWKFSPALKDGKPVAVEITVDMSFNVVGPQ